MDKIFKEIGTMYDEVFELWGLAEGGLVNETVTRKVKKGLVSNAVKSIELLKEMDKDCVTLKDLANTLEEYRKSNGFRK